MQLYVGNLSPETDESLLHELVSHIAPVQNVKIPRQKGVSGHQGYGFVFFGSEEDAQYFMNVASSSPITLNGKQLRVRPATRSTETNTPQISHSHGFGLFVGNLDPEVLSETDLRVPFSKFGQIVSIEIPVENNVPKGYAFVRFATRQSAETAKEELDGQLLVNRVSRIEFERS